MDFWLLLLLGLFTYLILQRRVAPLTRTPVWILWLVLMTPAFIWTGWILKHGDKQMPIGVAIAPLAICPLLYWILIELGRDRPTPRAGQPADDPQQTPDSPGKTNAIAPSLQVRPLTETEEAELRNCFSWTVYSLQKIEYRPQVAICRGQLRSKPEVAYQTIRENIEAKFSDRFLIIFQEDFNGKPFFLLVPNPSRNAKPETALERLTQPGFALALLAITLFTTTVAGTEIAGVARTALQANPAKLLTGLPYAVALMSILGIHELGHYLAARWYKIRATLPYFIPLPIFLGTFGAFIQLRSPVPNRKALFDLSLAGPLAGFVVTIPLLLWGLAHSSVVELSDKAGILSFEALNPSFSFLLTLLSKLALGSQLTAKSAIALHPVAIAGYLGLVLTAFNLMPVGQLDGGHIVHAMFGQRTAIAIGQTTRFLVLLLSVVQPEWFLFWAIFLFLIPLIDSPALNDVSELDNRRDLCGLIALGILLLIILPAPRIVWGLGLGG